MSQRGAPFVRRHFSIPGWEARLTPRSTASSALMKQHKTIFQTATGRDPIPPAGRLRMVAAVQPLVSGGVSKTVNVPEETTADEIESIFVEAWRLGLKAVSVFRQGSKIVQPLSSPAAISPAVLDHEPDRALELLGD